MAIFVANSHLSIKTKTMPLSILNYRYNLNFILLFFFSLYAQQQYPANLVLNIDVNNPTSYGDNGYIINDLSSSGNHLKIVNDVTHVANSEGYYSFEFGGSADHLKLNSVPFNDLSDVTNCTSINLVNLLVSIFQV